MNTDLLASIYELVRSACRRPTNIFGFGIWSHHIRPMIDLAQRLSPLHDADLEIVILSVLFHDYAGIKDEALVEQHHIHGADEARGILSGMSYPTDRIAVIEDAIRSHRGSVPADKTSPEARCLADCDAVSHIQQFPSLFYVAYGERSRTINDGARWVTGKLSRDWDKLSAIGRDFVRDTYAALSSALAATLAADASTSDDQPNWRLIGT